MKDQEKKSPVTPGLQQVVIFILEEKRKKSFPQSMQKGIKNAICNHEMGCSQTLEHPDRNGVSTAGNIQNINGWFNPLL